MVLAYFVIILKCHLQIDVNVSTLWEEPGQNDPDKAKARMEVVVTMTEAVRQIRSLQQVAQREDV